MSGGERDELELDGETIAASLAQRSAAQENAQAEADRQDASAPTPVQAGATGAKATQAEPKRANPVIVAQMLAALPGPKESDYWRPLDEKEAEQLSGPVCEIIDRDYPWLVPWLESSPYASLCIAVLVIAHERHKAAEEKREAERAKAAQKEPEKKAEAA